MDNESPIIDHADKETKRGFSIAPVKKVIIFLFAVYVVVFAVALLWCLSNGVFENESTEEYLEEYPSIDSSYVDDRLIVYTDYDLDQGASLLDSETLEGYLSDFGASIIYDYSMEDIGIYYIELDSSYTFEELKEICNQLEEYDGIESVILDWEVSIEPDDMEPAVI